MISAQQPINVVVSQPAAVVQPAYPPQPQVVVVGQQAPSASVSNVGPRQTHKHTLFGLGISECVIGSLSFLLAAIAIGIEPQEIRNFYYYDALYYPYSRYMHFTYTSQGIWCGIFVIVTGILGVRVKYTPSRGMYIANMIMAIITASIVFCGLVLSGIAAATSSYSTGLIAIHSIIALLCFASMVITITHSAFCCSGVCSSSHASKQQVVGYTQQQSLPQVYVQDPTVVQPVMQQQNAQEPTYEAPYENNPPKYTN